ncbi:MAG TPA: ribonuclease P protein component [Xanthomonadales bacterium]|nr:ribonuclease P protein component [Xanthomonadales bacterium]
MSRSFKPTSRLLKPADFKNVFNRAVISSDRLFRVFACVGSATRSRLGLAVSRKVDRRAVVRNRIKRIIRESFRHQYPVGNQCSSGEDNYAEGTRNGQDYVVVASPPSASADNEQIRESLSRHWQKVDLKLKNRAAQANNETRNNSSNPDG